MRTDSDQLTRRLTARVNKIADLADGGSYDYGCTGSKVVARRVATCRDTFTKQKTPGRGSRKVLVAVDMSGSMSETWNSFGTREVVRALCAAGTTGTLDVTLLLSGTRGWCEIPTTKEGDALLKKSHAIGGGEGLARTLAANVDRVIDADVVLIITDGHLANEEVVNSEWRRKGVDLIAMSICREGDAEKIRRYCNLYFARSFVGSNPGDVLGRVVGYIQNRDADNE